MLDTAAEAVNAAGYELGSEIALAVDAAASHFVTADGKYLPNLAPDGVEVPFQP